MALIFYSWLKVKFVIYFTVETRRCNSNNFFIYECINAKVTFYVVLSNTNPKQSYPMLKLKQKKNFIHTIMLTLPAHEKTTISLLKIIISFIEIVQLHLLWHPENITMTKRKRKFILVFRVRLRTKNLAFRKFSEIYVSQVLSKHLFFLCLW